ncbi:uncharacterized protein A4U43_C07F600 [Asparagus officinalis]|uniref:SHSP domain-containing protein n=1 Tax=Asparagus officinalis TaxID=4686 RepID=A0A5P1E8I2_ASPOF|nr:uncharacterized protein A4U43_C07F600 [Asparagus officinalis]
MSMVPSFVGLGLGIPSRSSNGSVFDPFLDFPPSFNGSGIGTAFIPSANEVSAFAGPHVDCKETAEAHVFKADLPGLKKEELKIEVEDGTVLKISGERKRDKEEKTDKWHLLERSSGSFTRRFRLPEDAKVDQVKAAMEDGVLTVTVPKEVVKKRDVRSIEISG